MNYFAVHLKHCKSTILQFFLIFWKNNKKHVMEKKITECFISGPLLPFKIMILSFTHLTKYQFVNFTNLWYSILQACHYLLEKEMATHSSILA